MRKTERGGNAATWLTHSDGLFPVYTRWAASNVNGPDKVALMGNFTVTHPIPEETWISVGEWMPRNGYRGDVLLARIRWSKPNRLPLW